MMDFKDIEDKDYRGIISIILVSGVVVIAGICSFYDNMDAFIKVMAVLGSPLTMVLKSYFDSKKNSE